MSLKGKDSYIPSQTQLRQVGITAIIELQFSVFAGKTREVEANSLGGYRVANETFESIVVGF